MRKAFYCHYCLLLLDYSVQIHEIDNGPYGSTLSEQFRTAPSPFIAYRISLWPLLKKDGLALQYFIFLPLWVYLSYESYPLDMTTIIHMVSPIKYVLMRFRFWGWSSGMDWRGLCRRRRNILIYLWCGI